jgi:hypothetical protein
MTLKSLAIAATLSAACVSSPASAMSIDNLALKNAGNVENVAWVCGPYRCWWQPDGYYYGGYGPRFYGGYGPRFYGGYGYRRWGGYRRW